MAQRALTSRHGLNLITRRQHKILLIPTKPTQRFFSAESIADPSNLIQIYTSRQSDPYENLSIEHFLLQKSHPDSVVLFLYTNRPCVVIGRNQNPWVEVNLGLVNQKGILGQLRSEGNSTRSISRIQKERPQAADEEDEDSILLVRRRSGGGTVFHDQGNVNYSVICPPSAFDRNKHAEMVVRALRSLLHNTPTQTVRVNERHDIVLDMHSEQPDDDGPKTYKISGSAYKLTRTRSLHHGTCLLSSPHLPLLSKILRSPAAPYIKARGVESVRSPVKNIGAGLISNHTFEKAVISEFRAMYPSSQPKTQILTQEQTSQIPEINAGTQELRSRDWTYAQTPQFTFSTHPTADDPRPRPEPTTAIPSLQMTVRQAEITEVGDENLAEFLKGLHLHHIDDWRAHVGSGYETMGKWLNGLFGIGDAERKRD